MKRRCQWHESVI